MSLAAPLEKTGLRVLVVEDDAHICELVSDILGAEGFETSCVTSDRLAYDRLRDDGFAALVIDINLGPGTTGFDVARFARQIDPEIPVIYVSGQTTPASFAAFGVPGSVFLAKPFTAAELTQRLRTLVCANEP